MRAQRQFCPKHWFILLQLYNLSLEDKLIQLIAGPTGLKGGQDETIKIKVPQQVQEKILQLIEDTE